MLGRLQMCVVFTNDKIPSAKLHAVKHWLKVDTEGHAHLAFEETMTVDETGAPPAVVEDADMPDLERMDPNAKPLTSIDASIDDDNEPAPENVPCPNVDDNNCQCDEWGHNGTCHQRKTECSNFLSQAQDSNGHQFVARDV